MIVVSTVMLMGNLSLFAAVGVSITGTVCDTSGTPLQRASVVAVESGKASFTDLQGRFDLSDLPSGQYHLVIDRSGYFPQHLGPLTTSPGFPSSIQIRLTPRTIQLPQVDVHGRANRFITTDGVSTTVSAEAWKQSGARTVGDALRLIPAVTIREGDHSQRISLRGSRPRAVQVDLDGVPLNDPGTGEADVGGVALDQLTAIEVEMAGDGGKVHLISAKRDFQGKAGHSAGTETMFGSHGQSGGTISFEEQAASWAGHLRAGATSDDGDFEYKLDDGTRQRRYNNAQSKRNGDGALSWSGEAGKLEIGGMLSEVNRGVPGLIYAAPTPEAKYDTRMVAGRVAFQKSVGKSELDGLVYAQSQDGEFWSPARQYDPILGDSVYSLPEWSSQNAERYGASASVECPFEKVSLSAVYGWQLDRFIGRDLFTGRVEVGGVGYGKAERQTHHVELGVRKRWQPGRWTVSLAPQLAEDFIEDRGLRSAAWFSPSVLLAAQRAGQAVDGSVSLGWSRSITSPPFNALFTVESMVAAGNRKLRPERGESLVLNGLIEPKFQAIDCQVNLSLFRRETSDFITWKRNAWNKYYPDNMGGARFTGAELSGRIVTGGGGVGLWFSYIYNKSRNVTRGDVNYGKYIPLTPLHSGSAGVNFSRGNSSAGLQGRWVGLSYSSESNFDPISTAGMGLPEYSVYDVNASHSFGFEGWQASVRVGVDNLFDRNYRVIERSPMPGRSYWVRLGVETE